MTYAYRFYLNMDPSTTKQPKQSAINRLDDLQTSIDRLSSRLEQLSFDRSLNDDPMINGLTIIGCMTDPKRRLEDDRLREKRSS